MLNKWFKVIGNSSPMMESITCSSSDQSAPIDDDDADDASERATLAKLIDSPVNAPFRKKAITSIERTRKLSILLKHQHYLVSFIGFWILKFFIIEIFEWIWPIHLLFQALISNLQKSPIYDWYGRQSKKNKTYRPNIAKNRNGFIPTTLTPWEFIYHLFIFIVSGLRIRQANPFHRKPHHI